MSGEPKAASTETWQRKILNQNKLNEISILLYDLFEIYSVINLKTNLSRNRPFKKSTFLETEIFRNNRKRPFTAIIEQIYDLISYHLYIQQPKIYHFYFRIVYATGYIFLFLLFTFTVTNSYFGKSLVWWKCTNDKVYAQQDNNG